MGKITKKSQLLKDYNKERNRIKRFIRNAEKEGTFLSLILYLQNPKLSQQGQYGDCQRLDQHSFITKLMLSVQ